MDDRDIETIVFESLGEVSVCWDPRPDTQVFDSTRARAVGDRLLAEIRARIIGDRTDELIVERNRLRAVVRKLVNVTELEPDEQTAFERALDESTEASDE